MLRSATTRLTLSYLAIIMTMSLVFSVVLYRISSAELNRELRHQPVIFQIPINQTNDYEQFLEGRLVESSSHLKNNLALFNIITLLLGSGLSYMLARRNLRPIEEVMEAQSRFTADASHELRTPLTTMQTEIEVALRNPKLTKEQSKNLLKSNLEEVGKLKALSDGLLRLARQDGQQLKFEALSLDQVSAIAEARLAASAQANNITIKNMIKNQKIIADKEALTETLVILLDNAIKYSNPNKTVTLSNKTRGHQTDILVADEGFGIKASDQANIFKRFYRADTSRSKSTDGYGLGLAIAHQVANLHGGSITVKSEPGKGSVFTLTLPNEHD